LKTTDQFRSIPDEDLFKYDVGQRHQTFLNQPDIRPFALTVADLSWSPGWVDDDSAESRKDGLLLMFCDRKFTGRRSAGARDHSKNPPARERGSAAAFDRMFIVNLL
jgi:hypothetical protein